MIYYEEISQEIAKDLIDSEPDLVILDVRTQDEYESGHIVGAICIPNEVLEDVAEDSLQDKEQMILVYSYNGERSRQAAEKLIDLGYTDVKEIGGLMTWEYDTEA